MKKNKIIGFTRQLTVIAALAALAGCASKGNYEQGAATGAGLRDVADKIAAGNDRIDGTMGALNDLVNNPQGDLVPKYKNFNDKVGDMQGLATDIKQRVADMRATGNQYFAKWNEQIATIKNQDIKNASTQREAQMQKQFMDMKRGYAQVQIAYGPFISDLKDIQTALSTDLTEGGLSAVKGATSKANTDAGALKDSLSSLSQQFRDLGNAMDSAGPAPAGGSQ